MEGTQVVARCAADHRSVADREAVVWVSRRVGQLAPRAIGDHARVVFNLFDLREDLATQPFELLGGKARVPIVPGRRHKRNALMAGRRHEIGRTEILVIRGVGEVVVVPVVHGDALDRRDEAEGRVALVDRRREIERDAVAGHVLVHELPGHVAA